MHIKVNTNIKLSIGYYQHFKTACILELLSKTKFSFIRLFLNFILKGLRFHRSHRLGEKFFEESVSKSSKHKNQFALGYIIYIMLHLIFSITSYLSNFSVTWKCMVGQVQICVKLCTQITRNTRLAWAFEMFQKLLAHALIANSCNFWHVREYAKISWV